jgi:hypothetical protein
MTRHRRLRQVALAVLLTTLGAGCAAPGGEASTNNDVNRCAAVLPLARQVVHGNGTLSLVRPINRVQIDALTRDVGASPPPAQNPTTQNPTTPHPPPTRPRIAPEIPRHDPKTCLVVYRGSFNAAAIPQAQPPQAHGQYLLIVLWVRHSTVDRVLITDSVPASARRPWWHR